MDKWIASTVDVLFLEQLSWKQSLIFQAVFPHFLDIFYLSDTTQLQNGRFLITVGCCRTLNMQANGFSPFEKVCILLKYFLKPKPNPQAKNPNPATPSSQQLSVLETKHNSSLKLQHSSLKLWENLHLFLAGCSFRKGEKGMVERTLKKSPLSYIKIC